MFVSFHFSTFFSSIFSISFHYSIYLSFSSEYSFWPWALAVHLFSVLQEHIVVGSVCLLENCLFASTYSCRFRVFILTMSFSSACIVCFARTYSCWFRMFIRKLSVLQVHIVVGSDCLLYALITSTATEICKWNLLFPP